MAVALQRNPTLCKCIVEHLSVIQDVLSKMTQLQNYMSECRDEIKSQNLTTNISDADCRRWAIEQLIRMVKPNDLVSSKPLPAIDGDTNNGSLQCNQIDLQHCLRKELLLFAYLFPFLLILSLYGNTMNILTYRKQQLRMSATIRLLTVRALSNIGFVLCMIPELLFAYDTLLESRNVSTFYWTTKPWFLLLINSFGTLATLSTVQMTIERYLYVGFPTQSKRWCTLQTVTWMAAFSALFSIALQIVHPLTGKVEERAVPCQLQSGEQITVVKYHLFTPTYEDSYGLYLYERVYFWLYAVLIIALSLVVLIICSALIGYKMWSFHRAIGQSSSKRSASYKKCVTMLTVVTAVCHLFFETPSMLNFLYAGLRDPGEKITDQLCVATLVGNFLSILNATLPFFVYLACVNKFREVFLLQYCRACLRADLAERDRSVSVGLMSQAGPSRHPSMTREQASSPYSLRPFTSSTNGSSSARTVSLTCLRNGSSSQRTGSGCNESLLVPSGRRGSFKGEMNGLIAHKESTAMEI